MDKLERKIVELIDENQQKIIKLGREIWKYPELGYKEVQTSKLFQQFFLEQGLEVKTNLAVTGVKSYLKKKEEGKPVIALVGEMDALPMEDSPYACAATGAAHACGHNAQLAGMMGAFYALADKEIQEKLDGNIVFFAVPAEEFVEMEFKRKLMDEGKIAYGGGKSELIREGAFDDIDISVGHHIAPGITLAASNHKSNGFMSKIVRYHGMTSHAAEAPHKGIDALSAANVGMVAINSQRESFEDTDTVRIHGFISKGGEAMNVIADQVVMEYSVRANNIPAILDANRKFDRAIRAGAVATGCGAEIITMPGYLPVIPVPDNHVMQEALQEAAGNYEIFEKDPGIVQGGSTDFGEVSHLMPVLQFNTGGYEGALHDKNMHPTDEYLAYVVTAKVFALTAYKLLKNGAENAKKMIQDYDARLSKESYMDYMKKYNSVEIIPMEVIEKTLFEF